MKQLQSNLGDYHDRAVQERYLQLIAETFPLKRRGARQTLLALGVLVEKLDTEKEAAKADFERVFTRLAAPKIRRCFKKLFAFR